VDEAPILGRDEDNLFRHLQAQYDAPAYVRRALRVQAALDRLVDRCRQLRDKWVSGVRSQVGDLLSLAGSWERLRPWLADEEQVTVLQRLQEALQPKVKPPAPTTSPGRLLQRLRFLRAGVQRFNGRWQAYLKTVSCSEVSSERENYNRYYLLEKECVLRSPRLVRSGTFQPLAPLTVEELLTHLPCLPEPELAPSL